MKRPYFHHSVQRLEEEFEKHKTNFATVRALRAELDYRTRARALRLRARIEMQLKALRTAVQPPPAAPARSRSRTIELKDDQLVFAFPDVHPQAILRIDFQRTLRIPDDGKSCPLPPGLGRFPLRHVDDFSNSVPPRWVEHGGVILPMYQAEALWLYFQPEYVADRDAPYPFAVKVATGRINAISGRPWTDCLQREPQDYLVAPDQVWLDGYCVKDGYIRQFVAMPLGAGYSAEEQYTGQAEHGGLQIRVQPMKREAFERYFPLCAAASGAVLCEEEVDELLGGECCEEGMSLAPGGLMRQDIYEDVYALDDWSMDQRSRCYVHIANSLVWRLITRENPPTPPPTAMEYTRAGLPWFEYYAEHLIPLKGSASLANLEGVAGKGRKKGDVPLPENESVEPGLVVKLRAGLSKDQVREGAF
jgi:hypothetical protein